MKNTLKRLLWRLAQLFHRLDFAFFLPLIGQMPLWMGYPLANVRGYINGLTGRDWRSMLLGFRHILSQSKIGLALIYPTADDASIRRWTAQRFQAEGRDEYDARLLIERRLHQLQCPIFPAELANVALNRNSGLVMLTPHYESAIIGIAFLANGGGKVNAMSSAITHDPRVILAVKHHFNQKYRGLESYLNGGQVLDKELGMRPFYNMLSAHETLVVLADAPALPNSANQYIQFLGQQRQIASGALRMAQKTHSQIGGFICRCIGVGRYEMRIFPPGPADDPKTINNIYQFFSKTLMQDPGGWWAVDLLTHMPIAPSADS